MTELENPMNYKNNNHTESGQIDCKVSVMACGHCKDCKHWEIKEEVVWNYAELTRGRNVDDYDILSEEESRKMFGYNVRFCESPKLKFWERPAKNEATVIDGSQYQARLVTAENFGCVNFESKQ